MSVQKISLQFEVAVNVIGASMNEISKKIISDLGGDTFLKDSQAAELTLLSPSEGIQGGVAMYIVKAEKYNRFFVCLRTDGTYFIKFSTIIKTKNGLKSINNTKFLRGHENQLRPLFFNVTHLNPTRTEPEQLEFIAQVKAIHDGYERALSQERKMSDLVEIILN